MPEACFLSIDSSEYMRNGDYFPSRLMAVQEAAQLLCNAKTQQNRENTIGFLTTGGSTCNVMETLTDDVDRVNASLVSISLSAKAAHFVRGLQIAALALSHRSNPRAEKRIVSFVGSPIREAPDDLIKLAKKLRKDNVAVDIVSIGADSNVELLESFVSTVNKDNNSRLLVIPPLSSVIDVLMTSAIFLGEDAVAAAGAGGGGAAAPSANAEPWIFGVDPSRDPELAMALRMSMEEERLRLEREAAAAAPAAAAPSTTNDPATPQNQSSAAADPPAPAVVSSSSNPQEAEHEMTEEEMMEMALKMSMEQYTSTTAEDKTNSAPKPAADPNPVDQQLLDDEEFMKQLKDELDEKK